MVISLIVFAAISGAVILSYALLKVIAYFLYETKNKPEPHQTAIAGKWLVGASLFSLLILSVLAFSYWIPFKDAGGENAVFGYLFSFLAVMGIAGLFVWFSYYVFYCIYDGVYPTIIRDIKMGIAGVATLGVIATVSYLAYYSLVNNQEGINAVFFIGIIYSIFCGSIRKLVRRILKKPDHSMLRIPFDLSVLVAGVPTFFIAYYIQITYEKSFTDVLPIILLCSVAFFIVISIVKWGIMRVREDFVYLLFGVCCCVASYYWYHIPYSFLDHYTSVLFSRMSQSWGLAVCAALLFTVLWLELVYEIYRCYQYRCALKEVTLLIDGKEFIVPPVEVLSVFEGIDKRFVHIKHFPRYVRAEKIVLDHFSKFKVRRKL